MDGIQLLLSAIVLVALTLSVSGRLRVPESKSRKPRQVTRWRRYRLNPAGLYQGGEGAVAIEDEADELSLPVLEGSVDVLPLKLGGVHHAPLVRLDRPRITLRPTLKLRLEGANWLRIRLGGGGQFPALEEQNDGPLPEAAPRLVDLAFVGFLADREYEIRWNDRLVSSISWQEDERGSASKKGRVTIEIVKSVPQLPFLALAVAFETVLAIEGQRIERTTGESVTHPSSAR